MLGLALLLHTSGKPAGNFSSFTDIMLILAQSQEFEFAIQQYINNCNEQMIFFIQKYKELHLLQVYC